MMQRLLLIAWLIVPAWAIAKPTLAVAPIDGDTNGKVVALVVGAAEDDFEVIGPDKVGALMTKLDITEIDAKAVKKLRKKLGAEIVVYGTVDKDGKKKTLTLSISARGKRTQRFDVEYKNAKAKSFKKELRGELSKRLEAAESDESNNDDDEEEEAKKKAAAEEKRKADEQEEKAARKKKDDDDDGTKKKKRTAFSDDDDDDGDNGKKKKKKKRRRSDDDDDDERTPRHVITQAAVRASLGVAAARRTLTYTGSASTAPPRVGTFGVAPRFEAELYPFSFDKVDNTRGLGFALEFEKTVGLAIDVPGGGTSSIDQMHYAIGARYRFVFGAHSLALGASYWHRRFVADRAGLTNALNMPDVAYKAVTPTIVARFAAATKASIFIQAEVPLLLSAGPIQTDGNFGPANVVAFNIEGGAEIAVAKRVGFRIAAQFDQIALTFKAATLNGVTKATDRVLGGTAALVIFY